MVSFVQEGLKQAILFNQKRFKQDFENFKYKKTTEEFNIKSELMNYFLAKYYQQSNSCINHYRKAKQGKKIG